MNDMSSLSGFALTPDQEEILSTADGFAKEELWPLQLRMDNEFLGKAAAFFASKHQ